MINVLISVSIIETITNRSLINMKFNHNEWSKLKKLIDHLLCDLCEDLEMAEPPDLIDIDPLDDIKSTELGALLWIYTFLYLNTSSMSGPSSGKSVPRLLKIKFWLH